ncbi:MAG: universal stress protein [Chloroflexi bacterium]|nr:universal stress protein [Chloroflexota bacterium]
MRIKQMAVNCDLIVLGKTEQSCRERVLADQPCGKFIAQSPASLLWAGQPRWPIQNILIILRFENTDDAAVEWLGRLAQPSGAAITLLPIVPSLPAMRRLGYRVQTGLDVLLSVNTPVGRRLRRLALRMASWQISGGLRLRQGEPEQQIQAEVAEGNYDLIVIGAEPGHGRSYHFQSGELVGPLLRWVERPLLVARPSRTS